MRRLHTHAGLLCTALASTLACLTPAPASGAILSIGAPPGGYAENAPPSATIYTITVQREAGDPADCNVNGEVIDASGTALTDVDYLFAIQTFTFDLAVGQASASQDFVVQMIDDALDEGDETFSISIQNEASQNNCPITVNPRTVTATIVDDDATVDPGPDVDVDASPGETVDVTFDVTGAAPPFALTSQIGTVTPGTLVAPGTATFSYTLPVDAVIGTSIVATVTVTDAVGIAVTKDITIQVVNPDRSLAEIPGLTPNQRALAGYLDTLCPRLEARGAQTDSEGQILDACSGIRDVDTTDDQVRGALDAINPEELIVAATTALRLTAMQNGNLMQRINALRSGASGIDLAGLNVAVGDRQIAGAAIDTLFDETLGPILDGLLGGGASADDFARWGLFANGNVKFGDKDATENEAGFDYDSVGIVAGVDYRFRENLVFGLGVGYATVDSDYDRSGGELDIEAWSASVFGTYFVADAFYLDGMLTWGSNDYDTARNIQYTDALGPIEARATGDTDGMQLSGGLSGGWDFNRGPWTFGPHAGAYYFDVDVDGFDESGAGGYDMAIGDQNAQSFQLNAGGHVSVVCNASWGVLIPHARVDYVHELADSAEIVSVRLVNDPFALDPLDPISSVELQTDRPDSDYVSWSVGASAQFVSGVSGFVNYRSLIGFDDFSMNEVTWGLRFERSF
jgi:outer membrane autotransporter protein